MRDAGRLGQLEMNARLWTGPDPQLDKIADQMDAGDVEAWRTLPVRLIDMASMHRDFRSYYRRAVRAGAIPADRGPVA